MTTVWCNQMVTVFCGDVVFDSVDMAWGMPLKAFEYEDIILDQICEKQIFLYRY